jgi:hypothetical protein
VAHELERKQRPRRVLDSDDLELVEADRLVARLAEQVEEPVGVVERVHASLIRRRGARSYPGAR